MSYIETPAQRMDTIGVCLEVIADLMIPDQDMTSINRDNLSRLLGFLANEYQLAIKQVTISV